MVILAKVMGKNLASHDEEASVYPPNPPHLKWQRYVSFKGHGEESGM